MWAARLEQDFSADENVKVVAVNAFCVDFPDEPFKVVASIPFHISTVILHRLLDDPEQSPEMGHLLVQKDLAIKHAISSPTTLKTLTWSPW
jgi:23S rRNA (adenine-N6)-dimethyltransferase